MRKSIVKHWPLILLGIVVVVLALFTWRDYGVGWDEPAQREIGYINAMYLRGDASAFSESPEKDHGAGYELILVGLEQALQLKDSRDIYLMRHLANHLFYLAGAFLGYILVWRLFQKRWLASMAFILLVFHPRLYGHSWANTKDIPILTIHLMAFLLAEIAFRTRKWYLFLVLGCICGFAASIRMTGILLPGFIIFLLLLQLLANYNNQEGVWSTLTQIVCLVTGTCVSFWVSIPVLWHEPFTNLASLFISLTHFRFESFVLFNGYSYPSDALPWYYLLEWFCITTPVLWLLAGFAGLGLIAFVFLKSPVTFFKYKTNINMGLYVLCFVGPLTSALVLSPVLYDDWRHFYLVYPPFVLLAIYCIHLLSESQFWIKPLFLLQFGTLIICFVRLYPFSNIYFNVLVSKKPDFIRHHFEMDYWGTSFKAGFDAILQHDTSKQITVSNTISPVKGNYYLLPPANRARIKLLAKGTKAKYLITNFRRHTQDYPYPVIAEIRRQGSVIMRVYQIQK